MRQPRFSVQSTALTLCSGSDGSDDLGRDRDGDRFGLPVAGKCSRSRIFAFFERKPNGCWFESNLGSRRGPVFQGLSLTTAVGLRLERCRPRALAARALEVYPLAVVLDRAQNGAGCVRPVEAPRDLVVERGGLP